MTDLSFWFLASRFAAKSGDLEATRVIADLLDAGDREELLDWLLRNLSFELSSWLFQQGIDVNPTYNVFRIAAERYGRFPERLEGMLARWDVDQDRKTPGGKTLVDLALDSMTKDIKGNMTARILKRFVRTAAAAIRPQVLQNSDIVGVELPTPITGIILQFVRLKNENPK